MACPANWVPGEEVIVPAPATTAIAAQRMVTPGLHVKDWYFATRTV